MNSPAFVLVHGGGAGSWCWDPLIGELAERGAEAVAMDLPIDDPDAGNLRFAEVVAGHVEPASIVVGHSLAGLCLPLIARFAEPAHLVYLAAWVPLEGRSAVEQLEEEPDMTLVDSRHVPGVGGDGRMRMPDAAAAEYFYSDCDPETAAWAAGRLRARYATPMHERHPSGLPVVPCTYVVCTEDRAVNPAWARRVARERLGVEPVEFTSGHAPFLSRPADLAHLLLSMAA